MRCTTGAFQFLAVLFAVGCASIPNGRYGVAAVRFRGVNRVDAESIAACLGTRERSQFSIDFGLRGTPACGEPPFDGGHAILDFWSWPWEDWPLFDQSVFERDVERIERWYRARGFYDARVVASEVEPPAAMQVHHESETCGAGDGTGCGVAVTFTLEEGEPSRIARMALNGIENLPPGMRARLRAGIQFARGDRFDEAEYERTKQRMQELLADSGYGDARVHGEVKVNTERREVYLVFRIEAGQPSVIGSVCVIGYGHLPWQPMLDVASLEPGGNFSRRALVESQRALYSLGVFSGVEVSVRQLEEPAPAPQPAVVEDETAPGEANLTVAEVAPPPPPPPTEDRRCNPGPTSVPPDHRAVDIDIRVTPIREWRIGFGVGLQAGQAVTFGTVTSFADQQDAPQWDYHASIVLEHRNLFDRLIRARLEIRPRVIFDMPVFNHTPVEGFPAGVQTNLSFRWPAFIEPRTNLVASVRHDLGPMPFTNFYRSEVDGVIGPERTFFDGRLTIGLPFIHGNWFFPIDRPPLEPRHQLPEIGALWLEEVVRIELRDDPRNPTAGAYFAFTSQQGVQPLGLWDFVRFTGEARGYVPLPAGIVIAGRFAIGVMEIFGADPGLGMQENIYQLDTLGPPLLQLHGGGASSNRGYLPGLLGDAEQVYVTEPRTREQVASGAPIESRPVRISGGTRLWEASLEVRIPITTDFGVVLFADAGDVDRDRLSDPNDGPGVFRFDRPQFAFGFGIRYRTIVGPLRLDVGVRPDELQTWAGGQGDLPPTCSSTAADRCRPLNAIDLGVLSFPGAFHLTIGEAF